MAVRKDRKTGEPLVVLGGYALDERGGIIPAGRIDTKTPGDWGADPLPDGTHRMVPSGDIVSYEERERRLAARRGR